MEGYYYLSQPYNGTPEQMAYRAEMASKTVLQCIRNDLFVFSPIAHNHAILEAAGDVSLSERRDKFLQFDLCMLSKARAMLLLTLPGWEQSYGVNVEIEFCKQHSIEIIKAPPENMLGALLVLSTDVKNRCHSELFDK